MPDAVREALYSLERVQKGRVWFEPYSDCLDPIITAMRALETLAGYDAVREGGGNPMNVRRPVGRPRKEQSEELCIHGILQFDPCKECDPDSVPTISPSVEE